MLRLLGQLSVYGTKANVEQVAAIARLPAGTIMQIGRMRKIPDADSWCYATPWYRFHLDKIDEDIISYLATHADLEKAITAPSVKVTYAFLTLCPVDQTHEETFSCILSKETIDAISHLGVALQIAPASMMPDVAFWKKRKPRVR